MRKDACSLLFEADATAPATRTHGDGCVSETVDLPALSRIPLDTCTIPQEVLNIEDKTRSNLLPWNGQFSPQLVSALLGKYAARAGLIVDPFVGSGTVLAEASQYGMSAFGADINPAAYHMAALYTFANLSPEHRRHVMDAVEDRLEAEFDRRSLFSATKQAFDEHGIKERLVGHWHDATDPCERKLLAGLIVLLDFYASRLAPERVLSTYRSLRGKLGSLPYSAAPIRVANADARLLPLPDACAQLVLSSPPYINVFNYHQQFRKSAEALGWNLLHVARSEIGSNRRNRGNRFLTVAEYCLDMTAVLLELRRVCQPGGRIILVVGRESRVRKTAFFNGEIVLRLATFCAALGVEARQERVFRNRFGAAIYEDILHFLPLAEPVAQRAPCDVAREVLTAALDRAPKPVRSDLNAAIRAVDTLSLSPGYVPNNKKAL